MRVLFAPTEDHIKLERTKLAADVSAGSNVTLVLENNNGMADGTYICIGMEGSELAELQVINQAVTGATDVRVATLSFPHKAGEVVTVFRYNKRRFYGATTEDGVYNHLTDDGSPVQIQVDDPQGTRLEYTGVQGYVYFKATYYNSTTTTETDIDDSEAVYADSALRYASLYGIRKKGGFTNNPYLTDGRIEDKRRQAENEINSTLISRYALPLAEIPPLITLICELLAAGYLHYEEFGGDSDGVKFLGEARGILKAISDGRQRLIGADMTELETVSNINVLTGKPDGTEEGREQRKFTNDQIF